MECTKYYPIVDCDSEGSVKMPLFAVFCEETISSIHSVWLAETFPNRFRLCCTDKGDESLKGAFSLRCPKCNHELRKISNGIDKHRRELYECDSCCRN